MFVPNSIDMRSKEIRDRIRDLRESHDYSIEYMANANNIPASVYTAYESGEKPLNYAFIYTCAQVFNIDINELIQGGVPDISTFAVTRAGEGVESRNEAHHMLVSNLAPKFRNRMVEPLLVTAEYDPANETAPIELTTHIGQEFDYILEGKLRYQIGEDTCILSAGDTMFFDSSIPHGMVAVGGKFCRFLAAMVSPEDIDFSTVRSSQRTDTSDVSETKNIWEDYVEVEESADGSPVSVSFKNTDTFNFSYDIVDKLADIYPDRLALVHISSDRTERRFTFKDIKKKSGRAANYLTSLGIKKGDRVMLVMRRSWQFWPIMIALGKIGAIAVPVTWQLNPKDYHYRFRNARINAIIACNDSEILDKIDEAASKYGRSLVKISVDGAKEGWCDFDSGYDKMSARFLRSGDSSCGTDPMLMIFQSYSDDMAQPCCFDCRYPLASFVSAKYWNNIEPGSLSLAVSDTAWAKALWGKLYGPWMCGAGVFVYDFRTLRLADMMNYITDYKISSLTAPASMLRAMLNEDISHFDLSALKTVCNIGEDLDPDIFHIFHDVAGMDLRNGYGQAETSLLTGDFNGREPVAGSIGTANPMYEIRLLDRNGQEVEIGEPGEICVSVKDSPIGITSELYRKPELTAKLIRDGWLHTGDLAWRDEDGYFWSIGRIDDIIKCAGYRIAPAEVEDTLLELPYILECGVTGVPDQTRGQIVKASIVLIPEKDPSEDLKTEIQEYVRNNTASYRYPRIVEFRTELPKDRSGKVIRSKL